MESRYFKAVAPDMDETTVRKHPSNKWEPKVVDRKLLNEDRST
jgi:hypothetical protein